MKVTLTSTTKVVRLDGVPARVWEGTTDTGIPVHAFVTRIAVEREADTAQFSAELQECAPPSVDVAAYPFRMFLEDEIEDLDGHGLDDNGDDGLGGGDDA